MDVVVMMAIGCSVGLELEVGILDVASLIAVDLDLVVLDLVILDLAILDLVEGPLWQTLPPCSLQVA
eukprot:10738794-Prorocentrum_lima.AAC.1